MELVWLNPKVVRVAMAGEGCRDMRWLVRSVRIEPDSGEEVAAVEEEVFDAVVVANGHYSQPRLPSIPGMEKWRRRQLHSHSYRVPDTFRDEVVVLIGCGDSAMDIALDLCGVAKAVNLTAKSVEQAMTPAMSKMLANHAELHLNPQIDFLCEDGTVQFADGTRVIADAVIYCTGYTYSFPFLDTGGLVTVQDNRVGPLFEHTFPPALAPSLSFVGVQMKTFVPWFFEAQGIWIARVLSGRSALPPADEMLRAAEEYCRAREAAGVPAKYTHDIGGVNPNETYEFVAKYTDLPPREEWKRELVRAILRDITEDRENFRDLDNDSESVREGVQRWLCLPDATVPGDVASSQVCMPFQAPSQL
ncbi:hypothetical protein EJB05_40668 [Eragrostis curvula]|uniref:Flavin-containing monooxygenase n=1 Tax=Eragrostis curvula TaxID=38414 RepID=A0A5J9TP18_9POAL|nr:hypothetical protein EJB05_40668 [Eragrostis curvula]